MALDTVNPEQINLDPHRLQYAYSLLDQWTTVGNPPPVPGAAILVSRNGKIIEPRFFGRQGPEQDAPAIRRDGMFLLASITKPFTYLAALKLVERGELILSDLVTRYIPDFAAHHKENIQVHHLFTHTSGMPDMLPDNVKLRQELAPLKTFIQGAIRDTVPLFESGQQVSYQSMGTLVIAELIQQITGSSIRTFINDEILVPLGMKSTGLGSIDLPRDRLIRVQVPEYQIGSDYGWNSRYWQDFGAPWGGMFCTPEDLAALCQCMLDDGSANNEQIWSSGMIRMATTNRLHDYPELPDSYRRTQPWGLGWRMNHPGQKSSWGDALNDRVFGHTGATGTMVWMDRERNGFCILLTTAIRSRAPWRLVQLSNIVAASFR